MNSIIRTVASTAAAILVSLTGVAPASALDVHLNALGGSSFSNVGSGPFSIDVELTFSGMDWTDDAATAFGFDGGSFQLVDDGFGGMVVERVSGNLLELQAGSPFVITNAKPGAFFDNITVIPAPAIVIEPTGDSQFKTLSAPFWNYIDLDTPMQVANSGQIVTFTLVAAANAPAGSWNLDALVWVGDNNGDAQASTSQMLTITAVPEPGTWALMAAGLALVGFGARRRGQPVAA